MSALSLLLWLPIAALLGVLAAGIGTHVRLARANRGAGAGDVFRCKTRMPDAGGPRLPAWPRRPTRAWWAHDVLLVQRGRLLPHLVALPARCPDSGVRHSSAFETGRGLGPRPVVLRLMLDDGEVVDVAARARDLVSLVGPFLAAAIPGLAEAPTEFRPGSR